MLTIQRHSDFEIDNSSAPCVKDKQDSKMLKISAIVALIFIVSMAWAASLVCDACGSECASACGTRRFRTCCFNYLRKKRVSDTFKFHSLAQDLKESQSRSKVPKFVVEDISMPEQWIANVLSRETRPYNLEDMVENHLY